ncbi:hypothetical protein J6590_042906 [Homalodisca vitripennis]|nr:hypothetical protein J6590_042906 [Homalodisca vitripennis]
MFDIKREFHPVTVTVGSTADVSGSWLLYRPSLHLMICARCLLWHEIEIEIVPVIVAFDVGIYVDVSEHDIDLIVRCRTCYLPAEFIDNYNTPYIVCL